jgi:subtilisin family serine protease
MAVRDNTGGGSSVVAKAQAINWAVEHGANIISVSQAGTDDHPNLRQAIANALTRNVVVVAAAGNTPADVRVGFPAAYDGVLAVGGTGKDGSYSPAAVTGPEIRIAAPCDHISSARNNQQWRLSTGTSNSTALVAGAAALVRARYPSLSARDVINRLTSTAIDKGPHGRDSETGFGLVNIPAALTANVPLLPPDRQESSGPAPVSTTGEPIAAPGEEFPVKLALLGGIGCLVVVGGLLAAVLLTRSRRRRRVMRHEEA